MSEELSIFCPDCNGWVEGDFDTFVQHRTEEHPPTLIAVATEGIESEERHGYEPADPLPLTEFR